MTTLTILVPHYNDPDGLALTLSTFDQQTWRGDREVIVCDDGSKPELLARVEEVIGQSRERVRLIKNGKNRGRPYTRNTLLEAADGKYTTWCDAGDEYYPKKIEMQLEGLYRARHLKLGEAIWCTCNSDWQWQGGAKKKVVAQQVAGDQIGNLFLGSLRAYLYTILAPTRAWKDVGWFDLRLPRLQDTDFFLRFVAKGGLIVLPPTDEPLCLYHKTDLGKSGEEVLRCNQYILKKHAALLMTRSRRFRRNRRFQQYQLAARFTANNRDRVRTAVYLGAAALQNPVAFARWMIQTKGKL